MAYRIEDWLGPLSDAEDPATAARNNARRAERAEIARKERLESEIGKIAAAFHGTKATSAYDWKKYTGKAKPSDEEKDKNAWSYGLAGGGLPDNFVNMKGQDGKTMGILDLASGKWYKPGSKIDYVAENAKVTGKNPFGKDFYDKYKSSMTGFYLPEVQRQYGDAKEEGTYRLARAGSLKSSAGVDLVSDLARQNIENRALIGNKATTAVGDLKKSVGEQETSAINLANASLDPTTGTNAALNAMPNLKASTPDLTPLGEAFKIATIGGASALGGYTSGRTSADIQAARNKYNTTVT